MSMEYGLEPTDSLSGFARSLLDVKKYYSLDDPANKTIATFAHATLEALHIPYIEALVVQMFEANPGIGSHNAVNLLLRGYQADLLEHDPDYPHGYQEDPNKWLSTFSDVEADPDRWAILHNNICGRQVQSSVADRYKTIKLVSAMMKDRFQDAPHHLDVGSSIMHGDIKLVYDQLDTELHLPFGDIELAELSGGETFNVDQRLSTLANAALRSTVDFGAVMGVDITNVDDPVIKRWAKSCSFYPDELLNIKRVMEFEALDRLDPSHERVQFFRGDFTDFDARQFRRRSPVREYDIITFSAVLYMQTPKDQIEMLVNAANFLSPQGIIIINDAPDGNFAKKFNFISSIIDGTDIESGPQKILHWENGRCVRAKLGLGKLALNGRKQTFAEGLETFAD